jgi:hypothetical protein
MVIDFHRVSWCTFRFVLAYAQLLLLLLLLLLLFSPLPPHRLAVQCEFAAQQSIHSARQQLLRRGDAFLLLRQGTQLELPTTTRSTWILSHLDSIAALFRGRCRREQFSAQQTVDVCSGEQPRREAFRGRSAHIGSGGRDSTRAIIGGCSSDSRAQRVEHTTEAAELLVHCGQMSR